MCVCDGGLRCVCQGSEGVKTYAVFKNNNIIIILRDTNK